MKFSDRVKLSSSTVKYETVQQDSIPKVVIMYMYINVIVFLSIKRLLCFIFNGKQTLIEKKYLTSRIISSFYDN